MVAAIVALIQKIDKKRNGKESGKPGTKKVFPQFANCVKVKWKHVQELLKLLLFNNKYKYATFATIFLLL